MELGELELACHRVIEKLQSAPLANDIGPELTLAMASDSTATQVRLTEEFIGVGPLRDLIANENVTEIVVNGGDSIWYEIGGQFHHHFDRFLHPLTLERFRAKICSESGISPDLNVPCADGQWLDFRVHLIGPPLSEKIQITLQILLKQYVFF